MDLGGVRSREKYTKIPLCIATAQVSGPETDRIGRPYQFFTVGGLIEMERTGIGWHWFGYGYGNWCSLNSTSDFLINWFFIGHGHGDWHGDWYWNGHSVNPLSSPSFAGFRLFHVSENTRMCTVVMITTSIGWYADTRSCLRLPMLL